MQLSAFRVRFWANDPDKSRVASGSSGLRTATTAGVFGTGQDVVEELLLLLLEEEEHPLDNSEEADVDRPEERVWACDDDGSFGGFRSFFGLVRELNGIGVEIKLLLPLQQPLDELLLLLLPLPQGVESCC